MKVDEYRVTFSDDGESIYVATVCMEAGTTLDLVMLGALNMIKAEYQMDSSELVGISFLKLKEQQYDSQRES